MKAARPRLLLSIGGWCGPALCLGKLGLRDTAFPFDFSRVTLDGIVHFTRHGFANGFFPPGPPPYRPECVGPWVLFRGQHTAFAHFDLNNPEIQEGFARKMRRWDAALAGDLGPLHFVRTVTARDPARELELVPQLHDALRERNAGLDYRLSVVVHDQGISSGTRQLAPIDERTALWVVEYTEDATHTLFDRSQRGYAEVVAHALDGDEHWPFPSPSTSNEAGANGDTWNTFPWRSHNNIALIDGVASVGGTCVGVGSTDAAVIFNRQGGAASLRCAACGDETMHLAGKPFAEGGERRPFTEEEDEELLGHLYMILQGGDKVEAVEQLAHDMNRGAFEIICRLQFLTQSSTKITEGLGLD